MSKPSTQIVDHPRREVVLAPTTALPGAVSFEALLAWSRAALAACACALLMLGGPGVVAATAKSRPSSTSATQAKKQPRICMTRQQRHCIRVPKGVGKPQRNQNAGGGPSLGHIEVPDGLGADQAGTQGAVDWAYQHVGNRAYNGWCGKFVAHAFGVGALGYATAWQAGAAFGLRGGRPPQGSLVFFKRHTSNGYAGHVGIALPGNRMISAQSNGVQVASLDLAYWRALYAGWAPPPPSWPGRAPNGAGPPLLPATPSPPPPPTPTPPPAPTPPPPPTTPSSPTTTPPPPPAAVTHYDCGSTPNAFGHYVPRGRHWANDFVARGSVITGGYLLLGANSDGQDHRATVGIYTGGPHSLSGELGRVTINVSGYDGESFTFPQAIRTTPGQSLWVAVSGVGDFTAYDQNNGGVDGCIIGRLDGTQ